MTKIEWTNETWNPVTGCTKISEGCRNCYAASIAKRFWGKRKFGEVQCHTSRLEQPLRWKKPRMIFVCSMGDLFHEEVPFKFINKVFQVIENCPQHIFQILTKRPRRSLLFMEMYQYYRWPENAWFGVSCENQKRADERMPMLMQIPVGIKFVSFEPLLEEVEFSHSCCGWAIVGCETGPKRRECKLEWVQDLVQQCKDVGVAVFVKQLEINGKVRHNPEEWPEDLRIREFPF